MPKPVVITAAALDDLSDVASWLTQPGSGFIAHRKLDDIHQGIADLSERARTHPTDPDKPGSRLPIIHHYAVRFQEQTDGRIVVERVFGPGQKR
jgi:plasmid stabilization system protein ParE